MGIHSIFAAAHTHTLAKGSHISPGGDRGRMAGLTQTHWRARTTHALTLVRPRSSQHTVRPQAYLARTHDRRGHALTLVRPRSSQHTSTPLQVPFHTRHVAWATQCGHTGLSRGSPIPLSLTPARTAQTLTLARARPLSPAPHRCPRPGGPPSRHITGSLTADTATQAELV